MTHFPLKVIFSPSQSLVTLTNCTQTASLFFFPFNKMRRFPLEISMIPILFFLLGSVLFLSGNLVYLGFPDDSEDKQSACSAVDVGSIPVLVRFLTEGNSNAL